MTLSGSETSKSKASAASRPCRLSALGPRAVRAETPSSAERSSSVKISIIARARSAPVVRNVAAARRSVPRWRAGATLRSSSAALAAGRSSGIRAARR